MNFFKLTQNTIKSVTETATKAGEAVGSAASVVTQAVTETAVMAGGAIGDAAACTGQVVVRTAVGVGEGSVSVASQATKVVTETVVAASGAIGSATLQVTGRVGHAIDFFRKILSLKNRVSASNFVFKNTEYFPKVRMFHLI